MKILFVNDYAAPLGGVEVFTLAMRDQLQARGHTVRIFASTAVPNLGLADYECLGTTSRFRTLLQSLNPSAYFQLRKALAEFRPDVVHVGMFLTQLSPLILPLLKSVPTLYHVQWYRPICPLGTKTYPDGSACYVKAGRVCYDRRCLPLRDWLPLMLQNNLWLRWRGAFRLIIANSQALQRRLTSEGLAVSEVIWSGTSARPSRPPLREPPTAVFAGRLVREKGVEVLIRAFTRVVSQIPQARLLIAGSGPQLETLQRLSVELNMTGNIEFTAQLSRAELERRFETAWVECIPSTWAEPLGLVAMEAMMRGTAVVASDTGGLSELVVSGETGFLTTPGDVNALAEALLTILMNPALAERLGAASRRRALAEFDERVPVEKFETLYRSLIGP